MCESFGWETGVDKNFTEAPQFYVLYTLLIFIGAGVILFPDIPLIKIMMISQVINGLVLPFFFCSMCSSSSTTRKSCGSIPIRTPRTS